MQTTRTPKPAHLTLDTLPDLFAHHRERFGGWTMEEPPAPTPPAPTPPAATPPAPTPPAPEPTPPAPVPTPPAPGEKKFDQAAVDQIIKDRLAVEKVKFDQQLEQLKADAGKTEIEKLTAERDRFKDQAENGGKTAAVGLAKAEAKVAALVAGGRDDRLAKIVAEADLTGAVADDGTVDEAKVKTAIEKVLTDMPEWKRTPGSSGPELGGKTPEGKPTYTRKQIQDMTPAERAEKIEELNSAMAEGRITG